MRTQRAGRRGRCEEMLTRARRQNAASPVSLLTPNSALHTPNCRQEATCIGCGCTDSHACLPLVGNPCHWLKVDRKLKLGVCSECEHKLEEFERRVAENLEGKKVGR